MKLQSIGTQETLGRYKIIEGQLCTGGRQFSTGTILREKGFEPDENNRLDRNSDTLELEIEGIGEYIYMRRGDLHSLFQNT